MKKNLIILFCCTALLWVSCNPEPSQLQVLSSKELDAIRMLGFKAETAKITDEGKCIVEGDIVLDMEKIMESYGKNNDMESATDRQQVVQQTHALPYSTMPALTFSIGNGFSESEKATIRSGVAAWAAPTNNIVFTEVASSVSANVRIILNNSLAEYGYTEPFPTGGPLSATISLSLFYINQTCGGTGCILKNLVTHEMGHALGFHHTDDYLAGGWLLYSPNSDPTSIMNSANFWPSNYVFGALPGPNANDLQMASCLYPAGNIAFTISEASFIQWESPENYGSIQMNFAQPGNNGRSWAAVVEVWQSGVLIKSVLSNVTSVLSSGVMRTKPFILPDGVYQIRVKGKNYKGDFTQTVYSNTVILTK